jgi:ATP-dependent DNA helicase RecG
MINRDLALIDDLRSRSGEISWAEFKENLPIPEKIGKLISALSNAALLADQPFSYLIWGIRDGDHEVVGTIFDYLSDVVSGEPWEFWLCKRMKPKLHLVFEEIEYPTGLRLVLLKIPASTSSPVEFENTAYIRIGSATPKLTDYPEHLKSIWSKLQPYVWESSLAAQYLSSDEVLEYLDYASYFSLTHQPLPDNRAGIFERLESERLITKDVGGHWNITNLGAILFAKSLEMFDLRIARKAVRFVAYEGKSRASTVTKRYEEFKGYANGFSNLMTFIQATLPNNEHIGEIFREEHPLYPSIALRELITNALIHQDMTITGAGPLIELFPDRMEISNPGIPLVKPDRFIDSPPRSRNEALAALMRRMRFCEEQGTGIDKVVAAVELFQLPPPAFQTENQVEGGATRVIIYAPRTFAQMTKEERLRACYQHAVLKYVSGDKMQNSSLRQRLGISEKNASQVSTVIGEAQKQNLIKPADPEHPRAAYIPFWA